jgi:MSHA biogenesis protein MshQ
VTLTATANGNSVSFVPNGGFPPAGGATLTFKFTTASSEAPFKLSYADAGQITLLFRAAIPGSSPTQYVQGTSNAFVVRPFGIAFTGMHHANLPSGPTGALFPGVAAGDNFPMTLTAYQWADGQDAKDTTGASISDGLPDTGVNITGNGTTPNFAATATVTAASNLAGAAGIVSRGATCATTPATIALAGGTATASDWCYNELGNVLLTATVSNYLGSGQDVVGNSGWDGDSSGPYVGRFAPKRFAVSNVSLTTRSDRSCSPASSFTYMDETMRLSFTVTAQNAQNVATQNYIGTYAKVTPVAFADWVFAAMNGTTNLTTRIDSSGSLTGAWANGVANVTFTTSILRRTPDDPDGPFDAMKIGIAPVDTETPMDTLDMNADGAGGNEHRDLGFTTSVRFGRLRLANNVGPEIRRLPLSITAEYWNNGGFVTNAADSCTTLRQSDIALTFATGTPPPPLATCGSRVEADGSTPPIAVRFSSGIGSVGLTAPGAGHSGFVGVTANLGATASGNYCNGSTSTPATAANLPYLLGRWNDGANPDGDANTAYDDNPSARAGFGLYGSQPGNFIYFRERY